MPVPDVITQHHVEDKTWGWEVWIVNNELYCGKALFIEGGKHTSMHFHMHKHETMYCVSGAFKIVFFDTTTGSKHERIISPGDSIVIEPGSPHEIHGLEKAMNCLHEFSTHHENSDSYRVGKPG